MAEQTKAFPAGRKQAACPGGERSEERPAVRLPAEDVLLEQISRLGGEERMKGAEGALQVFQGALANLVKENPKAYGAGEDTESQARVVGQLIESVSSSFLQRTVKALRHRAGYVQVLGQWVHRAVFTFIGFGLIAALVLPLCAVSLMSTSAWGWLPGAVGIVAALLAGAWILSRVRRD